MNSKKKGAAKNVSTPSTNAGKSVRSVQGYDFLGQLRPRTDKSGPLEELTSSTGNTTLTYSAHAQDSLQNPSTPLPDEQNPMLKVVKCIKSARKEQKLTQQQLADAAGVHVSFIAHLETLKESDALPSYTRTAVLERVLGLNERELWDLTESVRAFKGSKRAQALKQFHDLELELKGLLRKPASVNQSESIGDDATPLTNKQVQIELEDDEKIEDVSEMVDDFTALLGGDPTHRKQARLALRQIAEKASESEKDDPEKEKRKK